MYLNFNFNYRFIFAFPKFLTENGSFMVSFYLNHFTTFTHNNLF